MKVLVIILFVCVGMSCGHSMENMTNLITYLFTTNKYNKIIRPVDDHSQELNIYINFYLISVNDLDDVAEKLITTGYLEIEWLDTSLTWIPGDYGGIERILVPQDKVWLPDLSLRNGFTAVKGMGDPFVLVHVDYNGNVFWRPNGVFETKCEVNTLYFPFDKQTCDIEFGNWASSKEFIDVELGKKGMLMTNFHPNGQWEVVSTSGQSSETSETALVRFTIVVKRKPLYYIVNLVLPVVLLSFMINFTFVLPIESGEKMGYSITVYLAFAVFLTIISSLFPSSSQVTPLISIYLMILLVVGTIIIMITTLELRLHYRESEVTTFYRAITKIARRIRCKDMKSKEDRVTPLFENVENINGKINNDEKTGNDEPDITWSDVTASVDFLLFWFFCVFIIITTIVILSYAYTQSQ